MSLSFTPSALVLALNSSYLPIAFASELVCLGLSYPGQPINHPTINIIFPENSSNYILLFRYSLLTTPQQDKIKSLPVAFKALYSMTFVRLTPPYNLQTCHSSYSHTLCYPHTCLLGHSGRNCFSAENNPQSSLPIIDIISLSLIDQLKCYLHHSILPNFYHLEWISPSPVLSLDSFIPVITVYLTSGLACVLAFGIKPIWIQITAGAFLAGWIQQVTACSEWE